MKYTTEQLSCMTEEQVYILVASGQMTLEVFAEWYRIHLKEAYNDGIDTGGFSAI